jgi:outer membrane protein TolC
MVGAQVHKTLTLVVLFISLPSAFANSLTWQECVQEATQDNPDIAAAVAGVKNAKALLLGAYSGFLPQVSLNASETESGANGGAPSSNAALTSIQATGGSSKQYSESLQFTQNLFNGFADLGKVKQAQANVDVAVALLEATRATVSSNLKTAFAELLYEEKGIDLTAAILTRQKNNLRMVTLRYEGGNEHKGNQLYQVASVSQAQYQYEHAVRQVRNGSKQLAVLLGRPQVSDLRVSGELLAHIPVEASDFSNLIQKNPTHVQNYQTWVAAQEQVRINNGNWFPNFNLSGSLGRTGPEWPPPSDRWTVGLVFTYPLFPGTTNISLSESAYALKHQAEYLMVSGDNKLIAGLETAYAGLLDAIGQVKVAQDFYIGAQARSVIADGKYNTGLMTFEDWSVIDTDYTTRQQNLLTNQRNAMQAEAIWENALGTGDIK